MSLAPCLLVSMPQLIDPNFARAVVLLCEYGADGAFGLVLNRPADVAAAEAVNLDPPIERANNLPLLLGGPVEPERGWILTTQEPAEVEHRPLGSGLFLSASPVLLRQVLTRTGAPERTHVIAGYAGWAAGQLDAELAESSWLIAPVDLDLIFDVPASTSWAAAIRRLGADPHLLQPGHGVH
jgi:putative transcriptional regulator